MNYRKSYIPKPDPLNYGRMWMKKSNQKISGFRIPFNKHIQQVINSEFVLTKESIHFIDTLKNLADPMLEGFADECKKIVVIRVEKYIYNVIYQEMN